MKKVFTTTNGIIAIVLLLIANLTVNTLHYTYVINNPVDKIIIQPAIGNISGGIGIVGSGGNITPPVGVSTTEPTPTGETTQGINGVEVNEDNFIGEEQLEGEK